MSEIDRALVKLWGAASGVFGKIGVDIYGLYVAAKGFDLGKKFSKPGRSARSFLQSQICSRTEVDMKVTQ